VHVAPLLEMFGEWSDLLSRGLSDEEVEKFRYHERTGGPLETNRFIAKVENILRYSEEIYFDTSTQRSIAVGKHAG
jgi:hypothetical protein